MKTRCSFLLLFNPCYGFTQKKSLLQKIAFKMGGGNATIKWTILPLNRLPRMYEKYQTLHNVQTWYRISGAMTFPFESYI